ncbi:GNAT family N-acetyltransferase [Shewanella donghaensis]|uniref:GNAT family N-acetyltransferase n=1 Tax=Shewanella donghaensis TaxID=238836 RepID=UPI0011844387|nr:GNAT family N-acetyltransferase [Shewanella donghaensis]
MQIRKATIADAQTAFEIRNQAIWTQCKGHYDDDVLRVWTEGDLPQQFADVFAATGYVAIADGDIAGVGMIDVDTGMVDAMFVRPSAFGQGLGRAMLQHLESIAREAGCKKLILDASLNAVIFYRTCGFIGETQSIWHSPRGIDLACVPMEKSLM